MAQIRESWPSNIQRVNAVNRNIAEAFQAFHEALDNIDQWKLFVRRIKYPFLSFIMLNGTVLWPDEPEVDPEFLLPQKGLPFGVILSNSCEVLDTVVGGRGGTMPQA